MNTESIRNSLGISTISDIERRAAQTKARAKGVSDEAGHGFCFALVNHLNDDEKFHQAFDEMRETGVTDEFDYTTILAPAFDFAMRNQTFDCSRLADEEWLPFIKMCIEHVVVRA